MGVPLCRSAAEDHQHPSNQDSHPDNPSYTSSFVLFSVFFSIGSGGTRQQTFCIMQKIRPYTASLVVFLMYTPVIVMGMIVRHPEMEHDIDYQSDHVIKTDGHYYVCKQCGAEILAFFHYASCINPGVCVACNASNVEINNISHGS